MNKTHVVRLMLLFSLVVSAFGWSLSASAQVQGPQTFTLDGRIKQTGSTSPLLDPSIQLEVHVMDPSRQCVLYAERQTINTQISNGYFNIQVGSNLGAGKRVAGVDPGHLMTRVFSNSTAMSGTNVSGFTCPAGTYTPTARDQRYFRIFVTPSSTGVTDTLADLYMDAVPMAMVAETAEKIGSFGPADLLRVNTTAGNELSQANLETVFTTSNRAVLMSLLNGTSTLYNRPASNGTNVLPTIAAPTSPSAGQIWYNAGNVYYHDGTVTRTISTGSSSSVSAGDGTAAAPTISFASDPDTGWYLAGPDTLAASTGGSERVRITSTGRLGIGTTAPAVELDVFGNANVSTQLNIGGIASLYRTGGNLQINNTASAQGVAIYPGSGATTPSIFVENGTGDVGIGTTAPAMRLDVAGSLRVADGGETCAAGTAGGIRYNGGNLQFCNGTAWSTLGVAGTGVTSLTGDVTGTGPGATATTIANDAVSFAKMQNINTNRLLGRSTAAAGDVEELLIGTGLTLSAGTLSLDTAANVSGALFRAGNGTAAAPAYSFTNDTNTGLFTPSNDSNVLAVSTDGAERMRIDPTGNVGIGTTAPTGPLHVDGGSASSGAGAPITIIGQGGGGLSGDGGAIEITAGLGVGPGHGGALNLTGGSGTVSGNGGPIKLEAGEPGSTGGDGGGITLQASSAVAGNNDGGSIQFIAGSASGTGAAGTFSFMNGGVGIGTSAPATRLDVIGSLKVGDGGETCAAGVAGGIRYNGGNLQFCNGTAWATLGVAGSGITALTGDVTASGTGSVAATIANDAVTFAKMQNIATNTLVGRTTAGSGDPESVTLTAGTGITITPSAGTFTIASSVTDSFSALAGVCGNGYVPFTAGGVWTCVAATDALTNDAIIRRSATGSFDANQVTANSLRLNNAGSYVSINTPAAANYTLTLPADDGNANEVLATNGSGVLSWIAGLTTSTGFANGGNTFGANATLGLNDAYRLDFETSNLPRMTIDSAGLVGIGTTAPSSILEIHSPTSSTLTVTNSVPTSNPNSHITLKNYRGTWGAGGPTIVSYAARGTATTPTPVLTGMEVLSLEGRGYSEPGFWDTVASGFIKVVASADWGGGGSKQSYMSFGTSTTEKMRLLSNGNLGIGTTAPTVRAQVAGTLRIGDGGELCSAAGAGSIKWSGTAIQFCDGTSWADVGGGGGDFKADGTVAMTGALRSIAGTEAAPGITFVGDTNNGIFAPTADDFAVTTAGTERMRITSAGAVGIGTTVPAARLEVAGTIRVADGGEACAAGTAGGIRYNGGNLQFCNGTTWTALGTGSGDFLRDGTLAMTGNLRLGTNFMSNDGGANEGISFDTSGRMTNRFSNGSVARMSAWNDSAVAGSGSGVNFVSGSSVDMAQIDSLVESVTSDASLVFSTRKTTGAPTEKMRIDSNGNVGIGTTAPANRLDVSGGIATGTHAGVNATPSGGMLISGDVGIGTGFSNVSANVPQADLHIANGASTGNATFIMGASNSWRTRFTTDASGSLTIDGVNSNHGITAEVNNGGFNINLQTSGDFRVLGNGTEVFRVADDGNVGIGTTAPGTKLQVAGIISPSADNTHDLGTTLLRFKDIYAANNVIQTSDARLKTEVKDSDLGLDFINSLRPVSYYWKEGDKKLHYGVLAQETEEALSEAKKRSGREHEVKNVIVTHDEKADRYGVRYTELIAPIIKAIQELYAEVFGVKRDVAALKAENEAKDERIKKLEQENAAIKAYLCEKDKSAALCN